MFQLLSVKATGFLASDPFMGLKFLFNKYAEHAINCGYVAAVLAIALCALGLFFGSPRTRQAIKSHLVWIAAGVILLASSGYIVSWLQSDAQTFSAINPLIDSGKLTLESLSL